MGWNHQLENKYSEAVEFVKLRELAVGKLYLFCFHSDFNRHGLMGFKKCKYTCFLKSWWVQSAKNGWWKGSKKRDIPTHFRPFILFGVHASVLKLGDPHNSRFSTMIIPPPLQRWNPWDDILPKMSAGTLPTQWSWWFPRVRCLEDGQPIRWTSRWRRSWHRNCSTLGKCQKTKGRGYVGVSKNDGIPKSSISIGFSIIFTIHFGVPPYLETPICGESFSLMVLDISW